MSELRDPSRFGMKDGLPFQVSGIVDGDQVELSVALGYVNWNEPWMNGKRMSGIDMATGKMGGSGPPVIEETMKYDEYNRCYVSLKVKVDDDGKMPKDPGEAYLSIVVGPGKRKDHDFDAEYWLHPIATITKDGVICQNVHFNLLHWVGVNSGIDPGRGAFAGLEGNALKFDHFFTAV